jgi:hypothetical protein
MLVTDVTLLKEIVLGLDPRLDGPERDRTALVLIAALACATDTIDLAELTKQPREFVAQIRQRMMKAHLWGELDVQCLHWFDSAGVFRPTYFWVDVLVAQGRILRRWVEEEGDYRYWAEEYAPLEERSAEEHSTN